MFNNQIFGPVTSAPAIIYNDTNMSSDNISCTNLSGSIATFDQLSVVTFNPISFSADYADITNLSCDNLSVKFRSTMGSISTGNLSADEITLTGDINASDVYAANILSAGGQLLIMDDTIPNRKTMIRRDNASTWVSLGNVFSAGGNLSFDYGDMLFTTGPGTSSTPEFQIRKSTNGTFAYNSSVLNLSARVALLTQTEVENILNMNDGSTLTLENTASLIGQGNSTISSTGEVSFNNLSLSGALTCVSNISTPRLYVNDTFFYGSTGTIVSSLVTMSSQILYNLGDLDYKIISVSGTEYLTCDSTLGNTNISNLSCDNLSTNLLNNISAGENITLSTEAGTNKLVITGQGGLNSSNLSLDNLSVTDNMTAQKASVLTDLNVSNDLYVYGNGGAVGRVRAGGIDFKESTSNTKTAYIDVLNSYTKVYLKKTMDFIKDDGAGGTPMIMYLDWGLGNVNIGNLSADNISTDNISVDNAITTPSATITDLTITGGGTFNHNLINSLTPGANMSIVSVANKPRIGLNPDINISNMSVDNVSVAGELSTPTIRFKDNTQATKGSWFVYPTAMEMYTQNDFRIRNQGLAGSPSFMVMDTSSNNVNISNLSVSHFDVEFVDLTNNLSDGKGINITSSGGKAVISLQDPVNISTITTENMNVSGSAANFFDGANIYGTATVTNLVSDLTNTLSAGTNITITSVGGKAEISSTGGGGSVPANLSIDNLSVNFDTTIGGDLQMLSADIIATSSELFIQDVTCTRNMSVANAFGANSVAASSSLTVGTNATVTGNITSTFGDITAVTGTVFGPNVSGTKVTGNNLSVLNDATVTRDLNVQRYLDSGRPRFMMLARTTALAQTGAGERTMVFNTNSTAQVAGEFGVLNGGEIQVSTGGWYRLSWSIGFIRASGGDRYSFRSYNMTRTNAGGWTYEQLKDRIGSIGYCRSATLNQECSSVGTVLRYIPPNGWVRIVIGAMVQGSSNFSSSFNGTNLRASSNFMVEFISSASET